MSPYIETSSAVTMRIPLPPPLKFWQYYYSRTTLLIWRYMVSVSLPVLINQQTTIYQTNLYTENTKMSKRGTAVARFTKRRDIALRIPLHPFIMISESKRSQ